MAIGLTDSKDIKYLICHVILQGHMIKGFYDFKEISLFYVTALPSLVAKVIVHCGSGYLAYLLCHVILQDRLIKEYCGFMEGSSSLYVTTCLDLVAIRIVVVEMFSIDHVATCSNGCMTLLLEASHSKSPPCQVWWPYALW